MPIYSYTAKSLAGEIKSGVQEAASETELAYSLREQGFILTSVKAGLPRAAAKKDLKDLLPDFGFVPLVEKMLFARHLAVMIGAGLSISRALEALGQQTKNATMAKTIFRLGDDVKKGQTLADSMAKSPKVFSELFINMVRVGETAGNLEEILKVLAGQMEKDNELRSRVRSAMIYPAVIITAMLGIGILMMILVVPKLTAVFKETNMDLPFTTQVVIGLSDFMAARWIWGMVFLAMAAIGIRFFVKMKKGREYYDLAILKLPIFGDISKKVNSARLARTLGSLIESGVPIVQGLQTVSGTLTNIQFRYSLQTAAVEVQKGSPLSQILKAYPQLYPPMVSQMIQIGEETGTMGTILTKLAEFYEEEVNNLTKGLSAVIEPILMVVIGVAVGFFAISMIQPMYTMMQGV